MLKKKLHTLFFILLLALIVFLLMVVLINILLPFFPERIQNTIDQLSVKNFMDSSELLKASILSYKGAAGYIFIAIQVLQVVLAPVPGQISGILGGYVFGFWQGFLYTMIGMTIGSFITMYLGRIFGNTLLDKIVPPSILKKYDYLLSEDSLYAFFIIFLLPYFPDDAICFVAGLTRIKIWKLMVACVIGRLPSMAMFSFMGASIGKDTSAAVLIFSLTAILLTLMWLFEQKIKNLFRA